MSVLGRFLPPVEKFWASDMCRLHKLRQQFSVTILEKTDSQTLFLSGGYVPTADTRSMEVRGNFRSQAAARHLNFTDTILILGRGRLLKRWMRWIPINLWES
jgi:hypothetical protein